MPYAFSGRYVPWYGIVFGEGQIGSMAFRQRQKHAGQASDGQRQRIFVSDKDQLADGRLPNDLKSFLSPSLNVVENDRIPRRLFCWRLSRCFA